MTKPTVREFFQIGRHVVGVDRNQRLYVFRAHRWQLLRTAYEAYDRPRRQRQKQRVDSPRINGEAAHA